MVSKEILIQYGDLQVEVKENLEKKYLLDDQIEKLEKEIKKMENGGNVTDIVKGGNGGIQHFTIEGFPYPEYDKKRTILLQKKILLNQRKSLLEALEFNLMETLNDVQEYINTIEDSRRRRLITARVVDGLSWKNVAIRMGGNNTEDGVRMAYNRFLEEE